MPTGRTKALVVLVLVIAAIVVMVFVMADDLDDVDDLEETSLQERELGTSTPTLQPSRTPESPVGPPPDHVTRYLVAAENAGQLIGGVRHIPVYDQPNGEPRTLIYRNDVDARRLAFPLTNPTMFGEPLVLRLLAGHSGDDWFLVQAPVRPHRQAVWVRAADFEVAESLKRIEIDIAGEGKITLFDDGVEVVSGPIVSGRESRPTVLHDTYIEQVLDGSEFGPAYGPFVVTLATWSDALGAFGGGLPGLALRGTTQPSLMGQRVSSGGIRVTNELLTLMAQRPGGLVGANVVIFDSTGTTADAAMADVTDRQWTQAATTAFVNSELPVADAIFYT